ncbi:conserved hypothetical protein [Talaromyces stipitatus ATCC 10500]|uniref:Fungal N-terminal domain-containing protein n=1 Tax=Talaromyces stipitatus (strain ATCC 10500 / CBS 375.48 / QM 6759 / NRRL 1006) TaxID=441959 RepID=B8M8H4_TALSN|nr:uncharacterized protein TSTA_037080 [Talaromyces stipitatus ATCC 10500]EED20487.1 conserved hypothetical protein [Talaromyces stipitatus ATCC 10500]
MSGLEAVGVVSSIVQIADLGARVALKLCTVYQKVQQTESDLQNLSKDVSLTCAILQQFGKDLERDDQVQLYSQNAFKAAQEILDECGRVFREIESVIDKDSSTSAFTTAGSPFLKLSRKAAILLKRPRLDILRTRLDRLKNTVLLMINVIVYASQQRKRGIEASDADQQGFIEILMKRIHDTDQKLERLTRAIKGAEPVTMNTVGIFDKPSTMDIPASNDSDSPAPRLVELCCLSEVRDGQCDPISLEIRDYSRVIKDILQRIQDAESLLTANRHGRVKQAILDAHATELRIFIAEHGEKAGKFCTKFCQGPLFNQKWPESLKDTSERTELIAAAFTVPRDENNQVTDNMCVASERKLCATSTPDTEPERDQLKEHMLNQEEMRRVIMSRFLESDNTLMPTDEGDMLPTLPRPVDRNPIDQAEEWEERYYVGVHHDKLFDLKGLLSSWTSLTEDELTLISNNMGRDNKYLQQL